MNKKFLFSILIIFIAIALSASEFDNMYDIEYPAWKYPGDSLDMTLLGGYFSGPCHDVIIKDTIAFMGNGSYLTILNITDKANPQLICNFKMPSEVLGLDWLPDEIYASIGSDGVALVDISNLNNPVMITTYLSGGYSYSVDAVDTLVYLAKGNNGFSIYNFSDKYNPTLVSSYTTAGYCRDIRVEDTILYAGSTWKGMEIINISNPDSMSQISLIDSVDFLYGFDVKDTLLYLADDDNGLRIWNIANITSPTLIGTYDDGTDIYNVTVVDTVAFISHNEDGLYTVSISDPTNPYLLDVEPTNGNVVVTEVSGLYAYSADKYEGLKICNISDVSNIAFVSQCETSYYTQKIAVNDTLLFTTHYDGGFRIFDIADFANPVLLANIDSTTYGRGVASVGNYLYVIGLNSITSYDISDPINPMPCDTYYTATPYAITLKDNLIYAAFNTGLRIIDATNPSIMFEIGNCLGFGSCRDICVVDTFAYIAGTDSNLTVFSINAPSVPYVLGNYHTGRNSIAVTVKDTVAYLCEGTDDITVLSVAKPDSIYEISIIDIYNAYYAQIKDSFLYIANSSNGVYVYNVNDPASPSQVAYYETGDVAEHLVVEGHIVYVADDADGFYILRHPMNPINYYNITGTVGLSDNPADSSNTFISLMEVSLIDTTDMHGYYEFLGVEEGTYTLIYWHDTYQGDTIIDTLDDNHVIDLTLTKIAGIKDYMNMPVLSNVKTTDHVEFLYSKKVEGISNIGIYDVTGRNIYSRDISDMGLYSISTSVMPQGIYFLHIREEGNTYKRKVGIIK